MTRKQKNRHQHQSRHAAVTPPARQVKPTEPMTVNYGHTQDGSQVAIMLSRTLPAKEPLLMTEPQALAMIAALQENLAKARARREKPANEAEPA